MAKHLTPKDVEAILNIIRGWPGDGLTWDALCGLTAKITGKTPARQTLNAHEAIKEAYKAKKQGLKVHGPRTAMPSSLAVAAQRIARQQAEIDELKAKNAALAEQFVKWQYNAYANGLKEHQLNATLPILNRERTDGRRIGED